MHMWGMWKVCLQTLKNNRIRWKLAYFLKDLQISGKKTPEFIGLRKRNFQGIVFIWTQTYRKFSNLD